MATPTPRKKKRFFDAHRKKVVFGGPEEPVRQAVARWLSGPMGYRYVQTEYATGSLKRPDIVAFENDKRLRADVVIECKKPREGLDSHLEQLCQYAKELKAKFALLANAAPTGRHFTAEQKNSVRQFRTHTRHGRLTLIPIAKMPSLKLLRERFKTKRIYPPRFKRWPYSEIATLAGARSALEGLDEWVVGIDTWKQTPLAVPTAFDLFGLLADDRKLLPSFTRHGLKIVDVGRRPTNPGNPSGGTYYSKYYRAFAVRVPLDRPAKAGRSSRPPREVVTVSIAVIAQKKQGKKSKSGTSGGYTVLAVGVEDRKRKHLALELKLDWCLAPGIRELRVVHGGRMTGYGGGVTASSVIRHVKRKAPDLVSSDQVCLGAIPAFSRIEWDPHGRTLVANLIRYALLRDEVRNRITLERMEARNGAGTVSR